MIGVDTNVLVRFLVQDDEIQAVTATEIFENASDSTPIFLNNIVICELVWVLSKAYKYEKSLIVDVLNQLLSTSDIQFENTEIVRRALRQFIDGSADFSDYLIASINNANKVSTTYTFDKKAGKNKLFTQLS